MADPPSGPAPEAEATDEEEIERRHPTPSVRSGGSGPRRFPGWILIFLGGAVGGIIAGWGGLAFGALAGLAIWRMRAG